MNVHKITTPLNKSDISSFEILDKVYITGTIYMARDAAHKRMYQAILDNKELPFDIKDQIIYYAGPCPAKEGQVIGSCGPTTSSRMDFYTPKFLELGIKSNGAVYFGATGGAGALLSKCIKKQEIIAYEDLGAEALRQLYVEDFPVTVLLK